jgi:hypothetical protein
MTLLSWRSLFTATATVALVASAAAHADVLTRTNAREAARLTAATCPSKPTGKNFAGQNLTDHNFHAEAPGSLRGANFEGRSCAARHSTARISPVRASKARTSGPPRAPARRSRTRRSRMSASSTPRSTPPISPSPR